MTDAEPGDILAVEVLDMHPAGWGWTAVLPGFELLPEDLPTPTSRSSISATAIRACSRTTSPSP